jgi:hypothetical protein
MVRGTISSLSRGRPMSQWRVTFYRPRHEETAVVPHRAEMVGCPGRAVNRGSANVAFWDFALIAEQESQPDDHVGALFFSPIAAGCRFRLLLAV